MSTRREGSSALAKCLLSHMMSILHLDPETPCTLEPVGEVALALHSDSYEACTLGFSYLCFWGS